MADTPSPVEAPQPAHIETAVPSSQLSGSQEVAKSLRVEMNANGPRKVLEKIVTRVVGRESSDSRIRPHEVAVNDLGIAMESPSKVGYWDRIKGAANNVREKVGLSADTATQPIRTRTELDEKGNVRTVAVNDLGMQMAETPQELAYWNSIREAAKPAKGTLPGESKTVAEPGKQDEQQLIKAEPEAIGAEAQAPKTEVPTIEASNGLSAPQAVEATSNQGSTPRETFTQSIDITSPASEAPAETPVQKPTDKGEPVAQQPAPEDATNTEKEVGNAIAETTAPAFAEYIPSEKEKSDAAYFISIDPSRDTGDPDENWRLGEKELRERHAQANARPASEASSSQSTASSTTPEGSPAHGNNGTSPEAVSAPSEAISVPENQQLVELQKQVAELTQQIAELKKQLDAVGSPDEIAEMKKMLLDAGVSEDKLKEKNGKPASMAGMIILLATVMLAKAGFDALKPVASAVFKGS